MPNRILKESICTSETIAELTPFEETMFYRLIVNCDDFGRFDARPAILKGRLYPLADVTNAAIQKALAKLSTVGILELYQVDGRAYLQLCTWTRHQQTRASKSKYPAPEEGDCMQMISSDSNCKQEQADVPDIRERKRERETGNDTRDTSGAAGAASAPDGFEEFWEAYPKKIGKGAARKSWEKLRPCQALRGQILDSVERYRKTAQWQRDGGQYIPNPSTWLNQERWEDKPEEAAGKRGASYDIDELEKACFFEPPENL